MTISTDLTLINDISNFKLGHSVTFFCDISNLNNYNEYKLYTINNNELTEIADVSGEITNGLLVYKYYPQTSGTQNIILQTEEVSGTTHRSNTIQLIVNNNSHAANIFNANAALVANLTAMGIPGASTNDGLATNIAKVRDIPPAQREIELDTNITCVCPATASKDVPFNITGVLTVSYDDTSQANVDLNEGKLSGATVEIYNDNTLLGSTLTGLDGSYTFSYTPTSLGTLSIKAVYDSSNDYYDDAASSSVSVPVTVDVSSLTLTVDGGQSAILSYVDGDTCTLSATALNHNGQPVVGETVTFNIVNPDTGEVIDTIGEPQTTDNNGQCSVSYLSKDAGDLSIQASCNNIESSSVQIEDIYYYDACTSDKGHWVLDGNNTSYSCGSSGITVTGLGNTVNSLLNLDITYPTSYEVTATIVESNNYYTASVRCSNIGCESDVSTIYLQTLSPYSYSWENGHFNANDGLKFIVNNGNVTLYLNDVQKRQATATNDGFCVSTFSSRKIILKDIKVKSL